MGVAEWAGTLVDWKAELEGLRRVIAPALGRAETRRSAGMFIDGLFSAASRKTGWMLAEQAGLEAPYRLQSLLGRSSWSADQLRDLVRGYVTNALGDPGGVLVVDETGFLKKGRHSVGVGRQYSGTAGRIENCQVGVFVAYASRWGHALIDRQLYLPKDWADDATRRRTAAVPDDVEFKTKPAMAREMIERTLDAGPPCAWVLADALYGSDSQLRHLLEGRGQPYVLAVRSNHTLRFLEDGTLVQTDPATMLDTLADDAWSSLTAGEGAKGPRLYDWARLPLGWSTDDGFERWLLIRRSRRDAQALAYYLAYARQGTSLPELAAAAGLRWTIEECFLRAKDDLGLDHCEARSWHGWHRHMSLVLAAAAFLAKLSADQRRIAFDKRDKTSPAAAAA
ncbi:IS701 family transposase [Defluviicoccus vanus]|uniref:IS701 family transposase n=2 Tax=Defluviicoccus vanus TaxID=111831 RepID=A0A7H1N222_9PROT|nr:IS701 family transposase [Defluviicoccus vanus]QNT68762.1 IS701 family transposase [Defluviicoccus vanus]QNT69571.1 IS701 family transposase [Defluviicoccus vanus]QNT69758.1 IS701 family transposase [Defluviicoccus vanus]QNT69819.1 IS701 family transposase [Defluviicoccus vanus]QNT70751.1 IS701 family transposase [Defluviicoccus vanus]